jgi:AcrR family transcriptional regulator
MPRAKQTPEQIDEMRSRILEAARQILRSEGYAAVTIRAIAEQVGTSPMTLYTYFQNREALMAALDQRQRAYIQTRYDEMLHDAETGDVREVLRRALQVYARIAGNSPHLYDLLWVQPLPRPDRVVPQQRRLQANVQHLARLITLGIERGVCVPREPQLAAATAFGIVNSPLILYQNGRLDDAALRDRMVAETVEVALTYLCGSATS